MGDCTNCHHVWDKINMVREQFEEEPSRVLKFYGPTHYHECTRCGMREYLTAIPGEYMDQREVKYWRHA